VVLVVWEYLNEGARFYLKGAYVTPTGWKVALDWETTSRNP